MNASRIIHKMIPPGCELFIYLGVRLQQPSFVVQAAIIFLISIHILTLPFTAALNALVMIAVKSNRRLRAHKSNVALALLSTSDLVVGLVVQPAFTVVMISSLLDQTTAGLCALQIVTKLAVNCLVDASLTHLVLLSGERYLAVKHPFSYVTIVTESRLLVSSALAWLLSVTLQIPLALGKMNIFVPINNIFKALCIAFMVFCHVKVYRETRRHEEQLSAQQVTQEAREQFQRDKKAFKLTAIMVMVLVMCYIPLLISRIFALSSRGKLSPETVYIIFFSAVSVSLLNSLINPVIYSVRMRQFRVAFVELICRTVHIAQAAEEIEVRVFRAANAVIRLEGRQEQEGLEQGNVKQESVNHNDNGDDNVLR